jgi:carbon-monoxide dehydrogenase small subunit
MSELEPLSLHVNGLQVDDLVESRLSLADFVRDQLGLTGTHVGCEEGVCGACTVLLDGLPIRSCLLFAEQADGCSVLTIEGIGHPDCLHPLQRAFRECHSFQCGFCTPGFVMSAYALLAANAAPSDAEIKDAMSSNLCRCTGYQSILAGVRRAVELGADG